MRPFEYQRAAGLSSTIAALADDPDAKVIAGGTELVNWMKEGIARPTRLLDITGLPGLDGIEPTSDGLWIGALVRMADLADHPGVRSDYPAIPEALLRSASQQLRNMATMGGNLLQRTRCRYFRAEVELPCNKRRPGSGCAALRGDDRELAILGWSEACLATHPSDVAVALAALDAEVTLRGQSGERRVPIADFYRLPGEVPERDTVIERSELITGITVPASPLAQRSWYLKVRERSSYEFALVSAAAAVDLDPAGAIREARVALGGVAHGPWRLRGAEERLAGGRLDDASVLRAAVAADLADARPRAHNGFKVELATRAAVRALQLAAEVPPATGAQS